MHFPIALVIVAAVVEFIAMLGRRERVTSFTVIALLVGGVLAVISAWSGWELAAEGHGRGWALDLHRWLGVASAVLLGGLAIVALITWFSNKSWSVATVRAGVFIGAVLIAVTAHFGGEMVWGSSLLVDALFPDKATAQDTQPTYEEGGPVNFTRNVVPILEANCWKCHGPEGRAKGPGIRLTSKAGMIREFEGHALIVPGDPEKSLVHKVITLPRDDDYAMPPKGDGLSEQEIKVITTWIAEGAHFDDGDAAPAGSTNDTTSEEETPTRDPQSAGIDAALEKLQARGSPARRISQDSNELELNANGLSHRIDPPFGDGDMALLEGLQSVLVEIDLSNTKITNSGVAKLEGFDLLRSVKLKDTRTGDGAASVLAKLPDVKTVNFFGTDLNDAGLDVLAKGAAIATIYAGATKITDAGVKAAQTIKPGLSIIWLPPTNEIAATPPETTEPKTFKTAIEPILKASCWKCHGEGGKKFKLETREQLLAQHDGKPIVDPGKPESSLLYQAITKPRDADGTMPPEGPGLSDAEIAQIKAWIMGGAA
jgi:mono/diheme cytochrome c family protein/uncharacterized membrane protein